MVILLDTNVLSELARAQPNPAVLAWVAAQRLEDLFTTTITESEVLYGLALMPGGARRQQLEAAMATTFGSFLRGRVLPFDRTAAAPLAQFAALRRREGRPTGDADARIAAIGIAHGADVLATRNIADFDGCGLVLVNPWEE